MAHHFTVLCLSFCTRPHHGAVERIKGPAHSRFTPSFLPDTLTVAVGSVCALGFQAPQLSYPAGSQGGLLGDFPQPEGLLFFISLFCSPQVPPSSAETADCPHVLAPEVGWFPGAAHWAQLGLTLALLHSCWLRLWGSISRAPPALLGLPRRAEQAVLCTRAPHPGDAWDLDCPPHKLYELQAPRDQACACS